MNAPRTFARGATAATTTPCRARGALTACTYGTVPDSTPCDDGNDCTTDGACEGRTCIGLPVGNGQPCDDENPCTTPDVCQEGQCIAAGATSCEEVPAMPCT